jgi:hypothetical protein
MSDKPDVMIATPAFGGDNACAYTMSLLETIALFGQNGFSCQPHFLMNNAVISFARALCVHKFLELGAEYLFFIDSDLHWDPKGALALLKSPHEFVAGVYPAKLKDDPSRKVFQTRNIWETPTQNYVEADGVPGGFMRLKRSVIEKMIEAYPECVKPYKMGGMKLTGVPYLFEHIVNDDGALGEDYAFCERWKKIGGKIFIYPDITFCHYGRGEWHGNMLDDDKRLNAI